MKKFVTHAHFAPKFKQPKRTYSGLRDKIKVVYAENGNKEFIKVGTTDMYELAQSHKDACSIENIIRRATNDPSVLSRTNGAYADLTTAPETMFDAMKVISDAKEVFENLPADVKNTYSDNFDSFLGTFRTATGLSKFVQVMKKSAEVKNDIEKKEVVENA